MAYCPECEKKEQIRNDERLETVRQKSLPEVIKAGYKSFALIPTVNANPGYRWVATDSPDIERVGGARYYTIYT